MSSSSGVNLEKYIIPLDEIIRVTENFSDKRCIGGGGFGSVYRAQLSARGQNLTVAIKRLDADSHQGEREFRNEIEVISKFHHENIIDFVGYCDQRGEKIIVYEYASNGSLDDHLRDRNKMSRITWSERLEICIEAAKGLQCLHSGHGEHDIVIHRDVKSANILLDDNMMAKICDFGLSKLSTTNQPDTQPNTKVAGTQFYMDPTYHESGILRKASDVYSFGVVLFEIMSGMPVYSERYIGDELQSLMNTVRRYDNMNEPDRVADPSMRDQIEIRSLNTFKEIAYKCIDFNFKIRPTLDSVIKKLEEALAIHMYEHFATTPADGSMIGSIIGKLNSVSPSQQRIAVNRICLLAEYCKEKRVAFAQHGAFIPGLTHLLTKPDSQTQEALTAIFNIFLYEGILNSSETIPGLVHILEKSNNKAREHALTIILKLLRDDHANGDDENGGILFSYGAIPPIVLLLREGTTKGKTNAADALTLLRLHYDHNGREALRAGVVPILMELLTKTHGVLKEKSVGLLYILSCHPEGRLAIDEAGVVPHLVELIGSECASKDCQANAAAVLENLCSMDQKYLVEVLELGVMEELKDLRQHGTDDGKENARDLLKLIKDHLHVDHGSDTESDPDPTPTVSSLIANAKRGAKRGAFKISKIFSRDY